MQVGGVVSGLVNLCLSTKIPGFKPRSCRGLNICVTFFSANIDSAFHPDLDGEMSTSLPSAGGYNATD